MPMMMFMMMMIMIFLQNAPMLLVKDIGVGGMAFMKMLQETQMYSNYCTHLKQTASNSQQSPYNLKAQMPDKKDPLSLQTNFTSTTTADLIRALPSSQKRSTAPWKSQIIDFTDEGVEEFDAATELFTIATIGTIEMKASALQSAVDAYERLYGPRDQSIVDETLKKYASDLSALEKKHVLDPHSHGDAKRESLDAFIRKIDPESSNNKMFNENLFTTELYESEEGSSKPIDEQLQDSERPLTWCNGLVCGGYSNTPFCTTICMDLWERKLKLVRKQTVFKSIVKKHHHSNLVMLDRVITIKHSDLENVSNTHNSVVWKGVDGGEARTVKINLQPRLDVVRHRKETQSQFEKRREIVGNRRVEILYEAEGTAKQNKSPSSPAAKKKKRRTADIYGPGEKASSTSPKRRPHVLYARASSADSATWTIAQYYSGRDKRSYRSRETKALKVLKPLMLRFISRFRKYKFIESILLIQAHIRGFLVRNNIPVLVELLINRKIDRLLACIRIRNFIRFHEVSIWRKRVLMSKEMLLQRTGHRMTIAIKPRSATDYNNSRTDYAADASPRSIDSDHSSVKSSSSTEAIATPIVIPHTTVKPTTDIHAQLRIRDFLQYGVVSKVNTSSAKSMNIVRRASMERDIRLRTINEDDTASEASSPASVATSVLNNNNNFVSVVSEDAEVALNLAAAFSFDSDDGSNYGGSIKNAYSHSHTSGTSFEPIVDSDDETSSILALTRSQSLDLDRPAVSTRSDNASIDRRGSSDSGTSARKVITQSLLMDGSVNDEQNDDGSSIVSSKSYHSKDVMAPVHLLENQSKKFSPIGRFVAENSVNVNIKNVTTAAATASRSEIIKLKDSFNKSSTSIDSDSLIITAAPTEDLRKPLQRRRSGMWAPTKLIYDSSPKKSSLSSFDMLSSRSTDSSDNNNNNNRSPPSLIADIGIQITKDKVESSSYKQEKTSPALEKILEEVGTISNQRKPGAAEEAAFKYVRADGSLEILHANDLSNIPYEVLPTYVLNIDDDSDEQSSDETLGLFSDDDMDDNASVPDDLLVLLTQAPLRTMGPSVMDLLNRQEVGTVALASSNCAISSV
jgi:hypothetical protein